MYAYENEQKVHFKHKSYMKGSRNFSLEKLGVFRNFFSYALQYLLWFLSMGRRGTSARQSSRSSSRKKFGGPQPQRNHRAQLRSHARHVHEDETEIDFQVGVPKGLTPQPPMYVYIW